MMSIPGPVIGVLVRRFPKLSETFILKELIGLEAQGWRLHIFSLEPPSDSIIHEDVARLRAPIELIDAGPLTGHARLRAQQTILADRLKALQIAHVHAHFADEPAQVARYAAAAAGIGYSLSAHAKDIYRTAPALVRRNLMDARFVVTCTCHNAANLRRIAPGVPIATVYHGVDCEALRPAGGRAAPPGRVPLILSVARLRPKKGLDTLIEACALLKNEARPFHCVIAGYGPEREQLERLIAERDLGGVVEIAGKLPHDEVVKLYGQASLFVLPCRIEADGDRDGIPNVVLEAMAAGTPVISTDISGMPEVVEHGVNGLLTEPDNARACADAMSRLLDDPALAARLAEEGRRTVERRFTGETGLRALDRLLRGCLEASSRPVAYILKGFPRLSETFITNEILQLEAMGSNLALFALGPGEKIAEPVLRELSSPLAYLPEMASTSGTGFWRWGATHFRLFAGNHARVFRRRPLAYVRALSSAVAMAYRYRPDPRSKIRVRFIKEFAQAGIVADRILAERVRHVHGHFCHGTTTVTWLAAQLAGIPFSFTAHAKDIYRSDLNPGDLLERKLAAAGFVTTCTEANHEFLTKRAARPEDVHTVYHGLDTNYFSPASKVEEGPPSILCVGRRVTKKGMDVVIRACAILRDEGLDFRCRLVGEDGPATDALRTLIATLELGQFIRLDPAEPRHILRQSYALATIFALPCRIDADGDRDGIPNVMAEAMAMGLPVVSTDISGIPELVEHGVNGLLVPPDDAVRLAEQLRLLLEDANLRSRLGSAARETICRCFDSSQTTRKLKALLDQRVAVSEAA
jgi:glycosyltransferase involved in cell wall biosynthesis